MEGFENNKEESNASIITGQQIIENKVEETVPVANVEPQPIENKVEETTPIIMTEPQPVENKVEETTPIIMTEPQPVENKVEETIPSVTPESQPVENKIEETVPVANAEPQSIENKVEATPVISPEHDSIVSKDKKPKNNKQLIYIIGIVAAVVLLIGGFFLMNSSDSDSNINEVIEEEEVEDYKKETLTYDENLRISSSKVLHIYKESTDGYQRIVIIDKDGNEITEDLNISLYGNRYYLYDDVLYFIANDMHLNSYNFRTKKITYYDVEANEDIHDLFYFDDKILLYGNDSYIYDIKDSKNIHGAHIGDVISNNGFVYSPKDNCLYYTAYNETTSENRVKKVNLILLGSPISKVFIESTRIKGRILFGNEKYLTYYQNIDGIFEIHMYSFITKKDTIIVTGVNMIDAKNTNNFYFTRGNQLVHKFGEFENILYEVKGNNKHVDFISKYNNYILIKEYEIDYGGCTESPDICAPNYKDVKYFVVDIDSNKYKEIKGDINKYFMYRDNN